MLIPIGFFGGGGAAAGSYELITTVYGSGATTIDLTSIPSTYKHLQIRFTARTSNNTSGRQLYIRANSDTNGNYSAHALYGNNGSVISENILSNVISTMHEVVPGSQENASIVGAGIIDVLDYASTSKFKTFRILSGKVSGIGSNVSNVGLSSGNWRSTAAITSLNFSLPVGPFTSLSRFSIYGIKG